MKTTLPAAALGEIDARLEQAHKAFTRRYPGASGQRQPVHVVYGGAHLFRAGTHRRLGELALRSLDEFAPDFIAFAKAIGLYGADRLSDTPGAAQTIAKSMMSEPDSVRREHPAAWFAHTVYSRVREKLQGEPVEDYRIDFEDGYGNRLDTDEDNHAAAAASELAAALSARDLPPFSGIRIKPFTEELRARSIRTLDIFLTELASKTRGALPPNFCITLPKVSLPDEAAALADICSCLEPMLDMEPGALRIELMVETPQSIFNERGEAALVGLVSAARGRCVALHFGPYDYTASLGIARPHDALVHQASHLARGILQTATAGCGIRISDGPVNTLPIAPHRTEKGGSLGPLEAQENRTTVHAAWKLHYERVREALANGYYQGWDLHPAQLPTRYAAVYSFFLKHLDSASARLRNFVEKAAQATRIGHVFDDAAMAQGLLSYFSQGLCSGALTPAEVEEHTSLSAAEIRRGSFAQIIEKRRKGMEDSFVISE